MPLTINNNDLVDQCKKGDRRAFTALYQKYSKAMFNTSFRIVNNYTEAEDVLQESFLDAFRNINKFNYQTTFGGWLKTIVINKSINYLRKNKIGLVDIEKVEDSLIDSQEIINEEDINFKVDEIKKAIQTLPDGYRTVLCLYLLEGYDHEEIAEIMGVALSTARTQYIRGKQKLLQLLVK